MEGLDVLGILEGIKEMFTDFKAFWWLGLSSFFYLVIQILRGKAGFNIPWVTKKLEKLPKEIKTFVILGLFGVAGLLSTFGGESQGFMSFVENFINGIICGVMTIGVRNGAKQAIEGIGQLKEKMKQKKDGDSQ